LGVRLGVTLRSRGRRALAGDTPKLLEQSPLVDLKDARRWKAHVDGCAFVT
jgi:hypothetical protein